MKSSLISSMSMVPDLSLSRRLKRLLQSLWFMKMLKFSRPFLSSLASMVPLPSSSMSWKSWSRVMFWARMVALSLRMSCFSHMGLFLCLFSSSVLNYSRLRVFLPKANPVILCMDITSCGSMARTYSILVNSSTLSLPTPLRSACLNLFSRLGGFSFSNSYSRIIASSSYRLFYSCELTTSSPDFAKDKDFRKIWPHFLRAAAQLALFWVISLRRSQFLERSSSTILESTSVRSSPLESSAIQFFKDEISPICLRISAYWCVFLVLSFLSSSSIFSQWVSSFFRPMTVPSSFSISARQPSSQLFRSSFYFIFSYSSLLILVCECMFLIFYTGSLLNQFSPKKLWKAYSDLPRTLGRGFQKGQRMLKALMAASGPLMLRKDSQSSSRLSMSYAQLPVQMYGLFRCHRAFMPDYCSFFIRTKNFYLTQVDTWFTYLVQIWLEATLLEGYLSFEVTLLKFSFILDWLLILLNYARFYLYSFQLIVPLLQEQATMIFFTFSLAAKSIGVLL